MTPKAGDDSVAACGSGERRPLAGACGWLISDGKAGHETQARGVAEALGLDWEIRTVAPAGLWRLAAPFGPAPPSEMVGRAGGTLAPPFPAIAIAVGRTTIPYLRAVRRRAGLSTFTVILDDPRTGTRSADLISVPAHDRLRGPNVITTLCPPHTFSPTRLAALRSALPATFAALPGPRIAVLIGGNNAVYRFDEAAERGLTDGLAALARLGASLMITASRRTPAGLLARILAATVAAPRIVYDGTGDNPYPFFIAAADALVVTEDSVNMCGEAAATGRPVYVARLTGGSAKFHRFHAAMAAHGATRPLDGDLGQIGGWRYAPVYEADRIARAIEQRVANRRAMLGGLAGTGREAP
ncbi:MAG: mitochondrial fission ELM1 family protein [Hyphomicrobiaceae bacterium]